jgi:hypothetical protein
MTKVVTPTQRIAQAVARIQEVVRRDDGKLLTAVIAELAVEAAERSTNFVRAVQERYDALSTATPAAKRKPRAAANTKDLIPVPYVGELTYGPDGELDAYGLQKLYGNLQLRDALDRYTLATLKDLVQLVMERNPPTAPENKRTKAAIIDYIVLQLTGHR